MYVLDKDGGLYRLLPLDLEGPLPLDLGGAPLRFPFCGLLFFTPNLAPGA